MLIKNVLILYTKYKTIQDSVYNFFILRTHFAGWLFKFKLSAYTKIESKSKKKIVAVHFINSREMHFITDNSSYTNYHRLHKHYILLKKKLVIEVTDSVSSVKSIMKIINLEFSCLLIVWDHILRSINNVNCILHKKSHVYQQI